MSSALAAIAARIDVVLRDWPSEQAAATELQVDRGALRRYRRGASEPGATFVARLGHLSGRQFDWLLLGVGPERRRDRGGAGIAQPQLLLDLWAAANAACGNDINQVALARLVIESYDRIASVARSPVEHASMIRLEVSHIAEAMSRLSAG